MTFRIAPIIILIVLSALSLGLVMAKHGTPKEEKYNVWVTLVSLIVNWGLILWAIL